MRTSVPTTPLDGLTLAELDDEAKAVLQIMAGYVGGCVDDHRSGGRVGDYHWESLGEYIDRYRAVRAAIREQLGLERLAR